MDRCREIKWLYAEIEQAVLELNSRLSNDDLYALVENFQYTVYESAEGGHYDWHCDTGETAEPRKISLTLQLSEPSAYEGGSCFCSEAPATPSAPRKPAGPWWLFRLI